MTGNRALFVLSDCNYERAALACFSSLAALLALGCSVLIALQETHAPKGGVILFTDVTKQSGLNFQQSYGDRRLDNIVEGTGTGVCVFDYDNDGFLDV